MSAAREPAGREPPPALARLALIGFAALLALGILDPAAPPPAPATAPAERFSSARAQALVEELAREPHPTGSPANERVLEFLEARLVELGVACERQPWTRGPPDGRGLEGTNLLARVPAADGSSAGPVVLFVAHYDARPGPGGAAEGGAPGAGDDGAAVAAFLEALRALRRGPPPTNELWLLFTDGEERGLLGAKAFAELPDALERVAVVLNFEGRGNGGPVVLFETGRDDAAWVAAYARAVRWPLASSLGPTLYERLPNDTDFSVFKRRGLPGLNFAFIGGGSAYHRPWDTPGNLDPRTLQHHGEVVLGLGRALGQADLEALAATRGAASFLPLPGNVLIHYPQAWDLLLGLLAGLAVVLTLAQGLRSGSLRASGVVLSALSFPAFVALQGAALVGIWSLVDRAVRAVVAMTGAWARVEPTGNLESSTITTLGLVALAAFLLVVLACRARAAWLDTLGAGATLGWMVLAALALTLARGASHVLVLPLLFATLGLHASLRSRTAGGGPLAWGLVWGSATAALLVLLPVVKLLGQLGSITALGTVIHAAAVLALAGALVLPALRIVVVPAPRTALWSSGATALGLLAAGSALSLAGV